MINEEPVFHSMLCGLDYEHSKETRAYSFMHYEIIRLAIEAKKYSTRSEFQRRSPTAYSKAGSLRIKDQVCKHMKSGRRGTWKWPKSKILKECSEH